MPATLLEPLQNDSQLAALLSAAVAEVLEKQTLRGIPANRARTAANIAGAATGFVVPFAGLGTQLITGTSAAAAERHQQEQCTRTGLTLMQDAGFDIREAPVAWWNLSRRPNKTLADTGLPYRSQYLFSLLFIAYRNVLQPS